MALVRFLSLPDELHEFILRYAEPREIICCAMTCHRMWTIVHTSICLRYVIELFLECKIGLGANNLSVKDCWDILSARGQRWRNLRPQSRSKHSLPDVLDLFSSRSWTLAHGSLSTNVFLPGVGYQIILTDLPSLELHPAASIDLDWYSSGNIVTTEFGCAIDVLADLKVVIFPVSELDRNPLAKGKEYLVACPRYTAGDYPQASIPVHRLELPLDCGQPYVEISGDYVGFLFSVSGPDLYLERQTFMLLNWKTGDTFQTDFARPGSRSFAFLNDNAIVFPNPRDGTLVVYTFSNRLVDFSRSVSLAIPEVRKPATLNEIFLYHEVCASTRRRGNLTLSSQSCDLVTLSPQPFVTDPDEAIIVFALTYINETPNQPLNSLPLVTHKATLLRHEALAVDRALIPWNEWGPEGTRLLYSESETGIYSVHGTRFATMSPRRIPGGRSDIRVYDFNRRRLRKNPDDTTTEASQDSHHSAIEQVCPTSDTSIHPVETHLPYHFDYVDTERDFRWRGLVMDDERIVGFCEDWSTIEVVYM